MIHSFDVFDTCLGRRVAVPKDLHALTARRVAALEGTEAGHAFIREVQWARVEGEYLARGGSDTVEVTLEEIWKAACALLGWAYSPRLIDTELETEEEVLFPVPATLEEVESARASGRRIVYVTDTYLPEPFVREVLTTQGFFRSGDGLYVSNTIRLSKVAGDLFQYVLDAENTVPSKVIHQGDNRLSDHTRAREAGIRVRLRRPTKFVPAERAIATARHLSPDATSLWAGAMREARVEGEHTQGRSPGSRLGACFVAPVLFAFVAWVLRQAVHDGVERLYFVSRDCRIASEVARRLSGHFGDIDILYLQISRQSLLLPTAKELSPEGIPLLRRGWETHSIDRLLSKLELSIEDDPEVWAPLVRGRGDSFVLSTVADWELFWAILSGPRISLKLEKKKEIRQQAALSYLRSQGLMEEGRFAIVDLGWRLSSQAALNTLLRGAGRSRPVHGYYLEYGPKRFDVPAVGPATPLFWPEPGDRTKLMDRRTPRAFAPVIEHTVGLADHPSIHHYERAEGGKVVPYSLEGPVKPEDDQIFREVLTKAVQFADRNGDWVHLMIPDHSTARGVIQTLVDEVLEKPSPSLAKEAGGILAGEDQVQRWERPLARKLTVREAVIQLLPGPLRSGLLNARQPPFWLAGSEALTPGWVNRARRVVSSAQQPIDRLWVALAHRVPPSWKTSIKRLIRRG